MSRQRKQGTERMKGTSTEGVNWIALVTEDPTLTIPVGPKFQADVPDLIGQSRVGNQPSTERWLGEQTWPLQDASKASKNKVIRKRKKQKSRRKKGTEETETGKGRPDICSCQSPGSVECVQKHVTDERIKLETELGSAYQRWNFDEMGDVVSKSWTEKDQQTFKSLVKGNPISEGDGFMKPALQSLLSKSRANLVSYYLNVYLPRRISKQTRSGRSKIVTDEEVESESEMVNNTTQNSKGKAKAKAKSKPKKHCGYLSGRR